MKRLLIISAIAILCHFSTLVFGCSCIGKGSTLIKEDIKKTDLIFTGKVLSRSVELIPEPINIKEMLDRGLSTDSIKKHTNYIYYRQAKYLVKIKRVFKGKLVTDTVAIYTGVDGPMCGYEFKLGGEYIIHATSVSLYSVYTEKFGGPAEPVFYTSICDRTQPESKKHHKEVEKTIKQLNKRT